MRELRRTLDLDPQNGKAHFYLGVAQNKRDLLAEAAESFEKAISLSPEHGRAHFFLGIVLDRLGQKDKARAAYREAEALKQSEKRELGRV
jgi:Flp pilus assembly protein TadD